MTYDTPLSPGPLSPRPLSHLSDVRRRVLTARELRAHGVSVAESGERCRPGGPWQMLLPGVYLLYPGPPTSEDRLHAALLYAQRRRSVPAQHGPGTSADGQPAAEAMITGLAALALYGFAAAPPLPALECIDVLVPRTRRLRSAGCARVVRAQELPEPLEATGLPVAPVERALADAVARLSDAAAVRRLLTEAVRAGHCEAQPVVRELIEARLLTEPHVADAVDALLTEDRAVAEGRLYDLVHTQGLTDPCWNVDLRLPGGPELGGVDAYWPGEAVAVEIDARWPRPYGPESDPEHDALWSRCARRREALERLGITVVHLTPKKLREAPEQQAAIVRTALMAAADREPAAYVLVHPR